MCTNGINTGQFEQMIEQIDDHIKLERALLDEAKDALEDDAEASANVTVNLV